jgi:hypothetical protein
MPDFFPMIGKNRPKSSNDWKNRLLGFPAIGKLALGVAFLFGAPSAEAQTPDGEQLMMQVRAALPYVPLRIAGELQSRDRRGNIVRVSPVEMELDWGADAPTALYIVRDRFGTEQERLRITWPQGETAIYDYAQGDPPEPKALGDLNRPINGLNLDWADLSLSFLWWAGGRVVGSERVRGRFCYIVDLKAPEDEVARYAGVRLWIDPETSLLMQADAYDARNRPIRRLQVKSLRKIDDIWMVQNLDILDHATRERVTLRVRSVKALDDSFEEEWD